MARARNIKPGFYKNEDLAECSIWARFLFPGLWMLADRDGRLEDRPKRIKAELFPFDAVDADALLVELQRHGFIVRYTVEDVGYIQIAKFVEHQTPHVREQASTIPAPPSYEQSTTKAVLSTNQGRCETSPRSPDSLIPSSLIPDSPITPSPDKPAPFDFRGALLALGVDQSVADDWLVLRKKVKAANTKTALDGFISEVQKAGMSADAAVRECCSRSWRGFKAEWVTGQARASPATNRSEERQRVGDILTGRAGNDRHHSTERDITGESARVA